MSIRRKSNNDTIPKRDITIADETKKTVVVSLWNDLATSVGQELLDIADKSPIAAIKSLKVREFKHLPEAKKLRSWYVIARKLSPTCLALDSIRGYISFIKPAQATWYRACKTCNKKVTEALGFGKSNNDTIPKRDITIADETKKTVVVSLWNDLATSVGQELLDIADKSPIVAIKSLKVGEFKDLPEAKKLRSSSGMSPSSKSGSRSMYSDQVSLSHILKNPSLGEENVLYQELFAVKKFP
ncbi:replication protein a 70 kda dna-binding subunit b [Quercus suber]|uniref:Replication protein a 70 kDa dna-binding subunit b n=1 Tax=Quercus suber TaxID=58331 RepID=A0AAW0KRK3_QUESU